MTKTGFSFHVAYGKIPEVISRLKEIGATYAPIADRHSTFGFNKWQKEAKNAGLIPVFGIEILCVTELGEKKPRTDAWQFFAKDNLRPLHDLFYQATSNPGKEPSLLYSQALKAEGLFKIAGERLLIDALPQELPDDFYLGLSPATPKGLVNRARDRGINFLAKSDNYFPRQEDEETYRVALGWRSGTQTYPRWILSDAEWVDATEHNSTEFDRGCALGVRDMVLRSCHATMKKGELLRFPKTRTLRELCIEGAARKGCDLSDPVYAERLERELRLIAEKEFEDYFFIIADLMHFAKNNMICGPARGSSCGSLVCYLLDITAIDPIPFGLIFERFIDTTRKDLPDIDLDFSDVRRDLVFEYAEKKYGKTRVARLGSVGLFKPRSAINQAGKQLKIPSWRTDKVLDSIIVRSSGDSRAMLALEDTLNETEAGRSLLREYPEIGIASLFEGHPNNSSQHAAGIIITDEPVMEYVAVDARTRGTHCDKKDAEDLNLLKIDALGLTQLSIFERTLELLGESPRSAFFEALPLDDQVTFDLMNKGNFSGIFQFTGNAVRSLAKQVHFESINDFAALTALARPGPMATGGANAWVKRRNGLEQITTLHPMLTELTQETQGIVVFQETVMNIVRKMGQMSWEDTSAIRKAMSGRLGNEFFEGYWLKFRAGAMAQGVEEHLAKAIWDQVNTFGSWAFNKSHAVAYGIVSYWSAWLKAHHPLEFAAATLDAEKEPAKQIAILRELADEGVGYTPIDPENSEARWSVKNNRLIGPLTTIKGIGPAKVQEILEARKFKKPLRAALAKQLQNVKTDIDTLFPIRDRVAELHPDLAASGILTKPTPISRVQPGLLGDVVIIGVPTKIAPKDENEAASVKKRGGRVLSGPTQAINLFFRDDGDECFAKISRFDYMRLAPLILEKGKVGKSVFALKGTVPKDFRMLSIKNIRYLGEMQ